MPKPIRNIGRKTRRTRMKQQDRVNMSEDERKKMYDENNARRRNVRRRNQESENLVMNLKKSGFKYDPKVNYRQYSELGEMNNVCQYCNALKFRKEPASLCCFGGKITLPPLKRPEEPLFSLLNGNHPNSSHFLANIQHYNLCFQMTSLGANIVVEKGYNPSFKVIHIMINIL